jgi:hypothetical protein
VPVFLFRLSQGLLYLRISFHGMSERFARTPYPPRVLRRIPPALPRARMREISHSVLRIIDK